VIDPIFLERVIRVSRPTRSVASSGEVVGAAAPAGAAGHPGAGLTAPFDLDNLPPVIESPRRLVGLIQAASAASRSLVLLLGATYTERTPESAATDLARFFGEGPMRRFVTVGVSPRPIPAVPYRPGSLTFIHGELEALPDLVGEPFAAQALVIGGHNANQITKERLRALKRLLLPDTAFDFWFLEHLPTQPIAQLGFRILEAGFSPSTILDVRKLPDSNPLPSLRGHLKTLVSARQPE